MRNPRLANPQQEREIFVSRIGVVKVAIVIAFIILASRAFYLQLIAHEKFSARSEDNRVHLQAIPPNRGVIKGFNGRVIATNKNVQSVFFYPSNIKEEISVENQVEIIKIIADILKVDENNQKELFQRFNTNDKRGQKVLIKSDLSEEELAQLMVRRHKLPGMVIETSNSRYYPYKDVFSHSVGYLGPINKKDLDSSRFNNKNYKGTQLIGKTGVERKYEDLLHGKVGWQKVEVDVRGKVKRVLSRQNPIHGADLRLGIDASLQNYAAKLMEGKRGAIVAIEPKTGRIILLLSKPGFNPNLMVSGIDQKTYDTILKDRDKPFFNRFAQGKYPPASTIKPFYAITALEHGVVTTTDKIFDKGYYQVDGDDRRYRNWYRKGHGIVDMARAMRVSNDTYFFIIAEKMGHSLLTKGLVKFGFGQPVTLDVFSESSVYIPTPEWKYLNFNLSWFTGDNLNMGIGQGFLLSTPLQLAAATTLIANRGRWVSPRLLVGINNKPISKWENITKIPDVSADTANWDYIINTMVEVMENTEGTGYRAGLITNVPIAGKTGTAQVVNLSRDDDEQKQNADEYKRDHSLFIGFAPVKQPLISIVVIIENGGGGGSNAAPIAVKIIDRFTKSKTTSKVAQ